jgi:NADPH-dependent curcumin reductase CurA
VLPLLNVFARVPVCGLIAQYNATELPAGPNRLPQLSRATLTKRLTIPRLHRLGFRRAAGRVPARGFAVDQGRPDQVSRGTLSTAWRTRPQAFIGLLKGQNFGKQLVRVAP